MTELESARAHLRHCQAELKHAREVSVFEQGSWWPQGLRSNAEAAVLAALSWVWDAQERNTDILRITSVSGLLAVGMTITWPDGSKGKVIA
jgi:hypothetical protein